MEKNREFIKNTLILFAGKFATQFMSLLLLPLYTHYLMTDDYGIVDLIQTYISLFVPVLTFRIDSAIFRFLIDKRGKKDELINIISNILFILFFGVIITAVGCIILCNLIKIKYFSYVISNIIVMMISSVLLQLLRGLGKNKEYSIASIITGFTTLIINIILIVIFKFDASSILISSTFANFICICYIVYNVNLTKYVDVKKINKKDIKNVLNYSLPMIPNALSWWIVNVSDRTIISIFLGVGMNAIYTISCKFSNILNSIYSIINMSWQESATLHINDDDSCDFFTNMINNIFMIFSTISLLIISLLPFIYDLIIGSNYLLSYKYIPILLYANSWNVLIGLIGGIYIAKKKTKQIANTTIISAILNIVINIILINFIGLYAACISTMLSYMIMSIYRYIDCQKYVRIKLNFSKITFFTAIFVASSLIYLKRNYVICLFNLVFVIIYCIIVNKKIILGGINLISHKISQVKK